MNLLALVDNSALVSSERGGWKGDEYDDYYKVGWLLVLLPLINEV
jgi:hypothetical protein